MKIEIEVNEEQFATVLQKTIAELPKEKLEELVLEGFRKYLETNPNKVVGMVAKFSSWNNEIVGPTPCFEKAITEVVKTDEMYRKLAEDMLQIIKDNYDHIIRDIMLKMMLQGFVRNQDFQADLETTIKSIMYQANQNIHNR